MRFLLNNLLKGLSLSKCLSIKFKSCFPLSIREWLQKRGLNHIIFFSISTVIISIMRIVILNLTLSMVIKLRTITLIVMSLSTVLTFFMSKYSNFWWKLLETASLQFPLFSLKKLQDDKQSILKLTALGIFLIIDLKWF